MAAKKKTGEIANDAKKIAAAPSAEIGKEINAESKPETAKVEEKKLTPEEQAMKKKFTLIDEAMMKFNMYPVAANMEAKDDALSTLKKVYREGDDKLRQAILYVVHETIGRFSEYRAMKNFEYFKKKFPQGEPIQARMNVYKGMFNYSNSLEGLMDLINLLSDLGDDDSAKVLTYHFSFLCSFDGSEGARMLRNAIADALGRSKSVYALRALLSYAKNVEGEQLGSRVIGAIVEWKDRVKGLKITQKEKDVLTAGIDEFVQVEREEGHYR